MPSLTTSTITPSAFQSILSRYPATVPKALQELDTQRYETIPAALKARKEKDTDSPPALEKEELERLVEWKLKHGTFRPKLLQLVQSNPGPEIQSQTTSSFSLLTSTPDTSPQTVLTALKPLIQLKGIGPATASLVLSVYAPETVPFFSDELFRWVMWDETGGDGKGWKRRIKYNVKEYEEVVKRVEVVRERLGKNGVGAVDVERVAWVLGKEGVDVGGEVGEEGDEEVESEEKEKQSTAKESKTVKAAKAGVKRKGEPNSATEGVRRSTRRKTDH